MPTHDPFAQHVAHDAPPHEHAPPRSRPDRRRTGCTRCRCCRTELDLDRSARCTRSLLQHPVLHEVPSQMHCPKVGSPRDLVAVLAGLQPVHDPPPLPQITSLMPVWH